LSRPPSLSPCHPLLYLSSASLLAFLPSVSPLSPPLYFPLSVINGGFRNNPDYRDNRDYCIYKMDCDNHESGFIIWSEKYAIIALTTPTGNENHI
jgi:hypothetical protein